MKLIPVDEVPIDQVEEQILARRLLKSDMVGTLYPRILADEMRRLRDRYYKERGKFA